MFELERDLSSAYAERLALLPSKLWFRTEGYGLLAPATGQQIWVCRGVCTLMMRGT